jgi:uncharacterized surface protein with fasciclin (FAS1) repeats
MNYSANVLFRFLLRIDFKERDGNMKKIFLMLLLCLFSVGLNSSTASAQMMKNDIKNGNPTVGGAAMYKRKNIVENAMESPIHTMLVKSIVVAGLVETLKGKGPFTVFAPTDEAFAKLPAGMIEKLVKPENKEMLNKILTYHMVAGRMDSRAITRAIKKGGGIATFKTVSGGTLKIRVHNGVMLTGEKGGTAMVTTADVYQANGVIHVIDTVLLPE